ncbi:MAG: NF038122 family metalloprotease, partial [Bradyrhizobium sp.]
MQINVTFDSSVANAPTGFVAAINYVVSYYDSLFTNNVTINLDVGYGEVAGQTLASNALGESYAPQYVAESYSSVVSALQAQGAPGASTLPSTSPLSGTLYMVQAEAQALGLTTAVSTSYVGFSGSLPFSYAANATPASNQYYFISVAEHEISEVMGRVSLINDQPNYYSPMDLYRFTATGVRDTAAGGSGSTAYFSVNNGVTNLGTWNNNPSNGDLGDWYPSGPAAGGLDSFNDYSSPGGIDVVSANDITLMQALGWTTQTTQPSGSIVVSANATAALQGGAPVTLLTSAPAITDSGSTTLSSATVKIANGSGAAAAGDMLSINGVQNGSVGNGVTASWNAATSTLTLTGSASIAVYDALLSAVTYQDTGTDSSTGSHPVRAVTWTVNDGTNSYNTTSQVTIDRAPVATNSTASDLAGSTVGTSAAAGVLSHATDPDGDGLTVTGVSDTGSGAGTVGTSLAGAYGHLTLNADGSYSYVADNASAIASAPAGSHLQDTFSYTVSDGSGGTATATLTVTLDRAPVVSNSTASDAAGSTVTATAAAGVLSHASDPDGDGLTITGVSDASSGAGTVGTSLAGAYGHLTLNTDGSYSYVADKASAISSAPAGSHLQDAFSYTVSDGSGG